MNIICTLQYLQDLTPVFIKAATNQNSYHHLYFAVPYLQQGHANQYSCVGHVCAKPFKFLTGHNHQPLQFLGS